MSTIKIILSTFPSADKAAETARKIINENLAACVNIIPSVRSIYKWKGDICDDSEVLLLFKTSEEKCKDLISAIRQNHPYELPEIVAITSNEGLGEYFDWVITNH